MLDTVNVEQRKDGTNTVMSGSDPRAVALEVAAAHVECTKCSWAGLGGDLLVVDTSPDDNKDEKSNNFGHVSAELMCPTCNIKLATFTTEFISKRELAAVREAEQIVADFKDVVHGDHNEQDAH